MFTVILLKEYSTWIRKQGNSYISKILFNRWLLLMHPWHQWMCVWMCMRACVCWNITFNWKNSGHNIKSYHLLIFAYTAESCNRDVCKSKTWILQLRVTTKKASQIKYSFTSCDVHTIRMKCSCIHIDCTTLHELLRHSLWIHNRIEYHVLQAATLHNFCWPTH